MMSTPTQAAPEQVRAKLPPRWMVCTSAAVPCVLDPRRTRRPGGVRHARQMGSLTTRCGRFADYWVNFYDQPFDAAHPEACPGCRDLMTPRDLMSAP